MARKCLQFFYSSFILINNIFLVNTQVTTARFYKVLQMDRIIQRVTSTRGNCVVSCGSNSTANYYNGFSFNENLQTCDYGNCQSVNTSREPSIQVYVSCDTQSGFRLLTNSSVKACIWVSSTSVNYITARDSCVAKSSHLYTLKTVEKLWILQQYYSRVSLWVGLNDMAVSGTYRWEDDNTTCGKSCRDQLFIPGYPDNVGGNENCIHYSLDNIDGLNDIPCTITKKFICEKPCFNSN